MSERDLFANFERMRREMDELFGDVFDREQRDQSNDNSANRFGSHDIRSPA